MYDFGLRLKTLRESRNLSQAQLGLKIHKTAATISRYESNLKMPTLETLIDLSVIFNVPLDYLSGTERKKSVIVEGLSDKQEDIINTLILEFRNPQKSLNDGLGKRQQEILNSIIVEFTRK